MGIKLATYITKAIIVICACKVLKTMYKKKQNIIYYTKLTEQLYFKARFSKGGRTG